MVLDMGPVCQIHQVMDSDENVDLFQDIRAAIGAVESAMAKLKECDESTTPQKR